MVSVVGMSSRFSRRIAFSRGDPGGASRPPLTLCGRASCGSDAGDGAFPTTLRGQAFVPEVIERAIQALLMTAISPAAPDTASG
jgi:hypothetical protein